MAVKRKGDPLKSTTTIQVKAKPKAMYISTASAQYHPFAKKSIPTCAPGVELDPEDSWVIEQVARGLIKCLHQQ